jgi:hypothetical protein
VSTHLRQSAKSADNFRSDIGEPNSISLERTVDLASRVLDRSLFGIRATCLLRSLVLYRVLRESGIAVRIHLGVARDGSSLSGHAWLTRDGHSWLEPADPASHFRVVLSYPDL